MASTMSNSLLLPPGGKRRGRKPGLNSTVAQRSAANARERSRMRVLSSAFVELKGALPWVPKDTKLSKLDTLKLASGYIAYLRRILDTSDSEDGHQEERMLCENVSEKSLRLFNLATESTESLKGCSDPTQSVNIRRLQDRSASGLGQYSGRRNSDLTSSVCQELRPLFGIPSDCLYADDSFYPEAKEITHNNGIADQKLRSFSPSEHNSTMNHSKNSWQSYHDNCKDKKTYSSSESESPDYPSDRLEHDFSQVNPLMRDPITPIYGPDAVVLNTELSRLLTPTIKTLWETNRLDDICPDATQFPHMKYSTEFLPSQSVYPTCEINTDRLFATVGAKYHGPYFTKV